MEELIENILKLVTGEVCVLFLMKKNVNNVDYASLFVQKMQFQLEKI